MDVFLKSLYKRLGPAVLIPWLAGCASWAPGMLLDEQPASETAVVKPTPTIKLITADLIESERAASRQQAEPDIKRLLAAPKPYTIGSGDLLSILVWDHPELSATPLPPQSMMGSVLYQPQSPAGFVVDYGGMVQFPYVGPLKLGGLTEMEARDLLANRLARLIKKPDITLRVQLYRSKRIYVDGEVKLPGSQIIDDIPMTLLEGINRAGSFLPTADQSQILVNRAGTIYQINLPMLVKKGMDPGQIMLEPGDVVRVRPRDESKIYVIGEVTVPRALPMINGRLTLNDALGEVGGVNPLSSEARQVYVIRNTDGTNPVVYNLDARSPVALALAENFELRPKDVVYVDAAKLARFSRVVNLIVPSASTASQITNATR